MGKNMKSDKRRRNEKAAKAIKDKQSQKIKEKRKIEEIRNIRKKEKQQREEERQKRREEEKETRRQEKENAKKQQKQIAISNEVKTKEEERKEFIHSIGNLAWYERRVNAEIAEQKRKEAYLKYVYDKYEPKLEQKVYRGKRWEGKGDR